jgi:hypothetical protein
MQSRSRSSNRIAVAGSPLGSGLIGQHISSAASSRRSVRSEGPVENARGPQTRAGFERVTAAENSLTRLISEQLRNEGLQCWPHERTRVGLDSESDPTQVGADVHWCRVPRVTGAVEGDVGRIARADCTHPGSCCCPHEPGTDQGNISDDVNRWLLIHSREHDGLGRARPGWIYPFAGVGQHEW